MKQTFEEFLKDWHATDYIGTGDDAASAFDGWLEELDGDSYMRFGELYGEEMYLKGGIAGWRVGISGDKN